MSRPERQPRFFNVVQKLISRLGVSPAIAPLRRFAVRYIQPFLVRPFKGPPERRPVTDALKQIGGTLRAMGTRPEDSIVNQIGSEFRLLFCADAALPGKMSQPDRSFVDPVKSISDLLRKPASRARNSAVSAALKWLVALRKRAQCYLD